MPDLLSYYKNTFEESRKSFLDLAQVMDGELKSHPVADLSFESLYIPPTTGKKVELLILTSGIHGIEGYTGSALQRYFMKQNFFGINRDDLGILIIHGINPHGFQAGRRVTPNNVDLNRNFDISSDLFENKNEGYGKLYRFLNPGKKISKPAFFLGAVANILRYGMDNLRKAILKGQYEFDKGIFFGGRDFEPQVSLLKDEILSRAEGFRKVTLIDLHTGYGEKAKLHFFGDKSPFIDSDHMKKTFKDLQVDYGQEKDFYAVTGGFTVFVAKLLHKKSEFAGVVFEFGTIDSHKLKGSLESLYRMINEEKESFKEMFYPESPEWRRAVINQFETGIKKIFTSY